MPAGVKSALRGIAAPLVAVVCGGVVMLSTGMAWITSVYPPTDINGWGFVTWRSMTWLANPLFNASETTGLLFTGLWSFVLGFLVVAGVIMAVTRRPAGRWVAATACFLGTVVSAVTLISIASTTSRSGYDAGMGLYLFAAFSLAGGLASLAVRPMEVGVVDA